MKYDFTSIIDRRGNDALAVDALGTMPGFAPEPPLEGFDVIPMWVADMNFPTCPAIQEAIIRRVRHPAFGYFVIRDEYYEKIIQWQTKRNGYANLLREYIGYENGVHGCLTSAVEALSHPGDKILLHSPAYVGFSMDTEGIGRTPVYSPLKRDDAGVWRMDYADMDAKLKADNIHLAIFCSPHNPCGRVWERWELERAMEVFAANDCYVISDEIWADLTFPGRQHIPTPMVNEWSKEHTVAAYAPSKTFNLAGLTASYHIIYNKYLRDRVRGHGHATHYNEINVLSMHALMAAYGPEGYEWLNELLPVLENNANYACSYVKEHFPGVDAARPEGTYMIFLDCSGYCERTGKSLDEVIKAGWNVGVGWQDGRRFHGPCHIRINLASPLSRIQEAFYRLEEHVFRI